MPIPVTDIADDDQLVRYATAAQIALLKSGVETGTKIPTRAIAAAMGIAHSNLNGALRGKLTSEMMRKLDGAITALAPTMVRTGGLVALGARLKRSQNPATVSARIPPVWIRDFLQEQVRGQVGVLVQAAALLSALLLAVGEAATRRVREEYRVELGRIVDRLILVGVSPPTPYTVEALILLGGIGSQAFDGAVRDRLEQSLRNSPLGFRVWRGITSVVHSSQDGSTGLSTDSIRHWVRPLLEDAQRLRRTSIYPARSLDLELAIAVPAAWSPPEEDWASDLLRSRAEMGGAQGATVRERATAALGVWERALNGQSRALRALAQGYLRELARRFRAEKADADAVAPTGLKWTADTLDHAIETDQTVCNEWPDSDEACLHIVRAAAASLTIPEQIRQDTIFLFEQAVLQNAGVYRRRAIETLWAGGWARRTIPAFDKILRHADAEPWLRCRVIFAIGLLQERGDDVQHVLYQAYERARANIDQPTVTRDLISELHAAIFAIGDCFGAEGAESEAHRMRTRLDRTLPDVVSDRIDSLHHPIARATGYLLAVTEQPNDQLWLSRLRNHPDATTRDIAKWTLERRQGVGGG